MPIGKIIEYCNHSFTSQMNSPFPTKLVNGIGFEDEKLSENKLTEVYALENGKSFQQHFEPMEDPKEQSKFEVKKERTKVHPFEEVEDIFNGTNIRLPRTESVMDEEIRIGKEKENEWRLSRGINVLPNINETKQNSVVYFIKTHVEDTPFTKLPTQSHKDEAKKRLAQNRLKTEILENKRREVDLIKEGKIISLSESADFEIPRAPSYISQYSKDELEGVSLNLLKGLYMKDSIKECDITVEEDEELKNCKIQLPMDHFLELEKHPQKKVVNKFIRENKSESILVSRNMNAIKESKEHDMDVINKVGENGGNENIELDYRNQFILDNNFINIQKIVEKFDIKEIKRDWKENSTYKTNDDIQVKKETKLYRRSLGPGGFTKLVGHRDIENQIVMELKDAKKREEELKNLKRFILENGGR